MMTHTLFTHELSGYNKIYKNIYNAEVRSIIYKTIDGIWNDDFVPFFNAISETIR